ncbi:unnamed protein product, partial [Choristocarpus tenellus]
FRLPQRAKARHSVHCRRAKTPHRRREALTASKVGLIVEDHPLTLIYKTRRRG